jgi:hypothetical protein
MRNSRLLCVALACALSAVLNAEVQVNMRTSGSQANPAVAMDPAGGSIIVWSSYFSTPGRSNDIFARRLDPLGGFAGDEFQVNMGNEGNQTEPAVVTDGRGNFAVAWEGPGLEEEDIFLRLFDPNGRAVSDELLINSGTAGRQLYPSVAATDAGRLIVAWESREIIEDVNRTSIHARVFEPNGAPLGDDILANASLYDCRYPDVAADASGRFVVVWVQERSTNTIMARLFDPNDVPAGEPFEVSTAVISSITRPAVAMTSLGRFVIVWDGDPNRASEDDIHARLYDPNAQPLGEPFVVNTLRDGAQQWPQVAINDANEFVVVWEHDTGDPNAATDVFARRFNAAGQPVGEQFQINSYTQDRQRYPAVAMADGGSFVAAWESNGQDGAGYGIFAHREGPALPADPNMIGP